MMNFCSITRTPPENLHRYRQPILLQDNLFDFNDTTKAKVKAQRIESSSNGISYFYIDNEEFFEAVHKYFQKKTNSTCVLVEQNYSLPDGIAIKQDHALKLHLRNNRAKNNKVVGMHFTIFPVKDMLVNDFEEALNCINSSVPCAFELKGANEYAVADSSKCDEESNHFNLMLEDYSLPYNAYLREACLCLKESHENALNAKNSNLSFQFWFFDMFLRTNENIPKDMLFTDTVMGQTVCLALEQCNDCNNIHNEIFRDMMRMEYENIFHHNPKYRASETETDSDIEEVNDIHECHVNEKEKVCQNIIL